MFFSQARAAGYMFAFPPLSKATFTSGPEEKGTTVYESMQATAASSTLKLSAHLVCAGRRRLSRVLLFVYFLAKGTCIPLKLRWHSEFRWFWMNAKSLTGKDVWKDNETWSKLKMILGGKQRNNFHSLNIQIKVICSSFVHIERYLLKYCILLPLPATVKMKIGLKG